MSQSDLAGLLGISGSSVSAVENMHVKPWPRFRREAARALNVTEDELFADQDHRYDPSLTAQLDRLITVLDQHTTRIAELVTKVDTLEERIWETYHRE
jgi:transcriptional regulator with XRE-family HTH domain